MAGLASCSGVVCRSSGFCHGTVSIPSARSDSGENQLRGRRARQDDELVTRIRVLGEFAVEGESGTVDLPGGLPRQLVGYLALPRLPIPRRELGKMLWPDGEEESRPQRLRTALWETQRALAQAGAPALEPTRSTISLSPLVVVDLEEASRLLSAGAAEAALRLLEPGLSRELDQDWATPARRRARLLLVERCSVWR